MKSLKEQLEEAGKGKYSIEVSVRDAQEAYELLNDDPNLKFKQKDSNYFVFPNEEELQAALEKLQMQGIEIEDMQLGEAVKTEARRGNPDLSDDEEWKMAISHAVDDLEDAIKGFNIEEYVEKMNTTSLEGFMETLERVTRVMMKHK